RYAVSRSHCVMMVVSHSITGNISLSGAKRVTVPVTRAGWRHWTEGGVGTWGLGIARTAPVGFPRSYDWLKIFPSRWTSTTISDARALTTESTRPYSRNVTVWRAPRTF